MDIRVSGKNLNITAGMREHLTGRIEKFEKYAPRLVEAHVILKKEKHLFQAEVTLLAKNFRAYGEGQEKENIYTAMDLACQRVQKQLKKFREKVKNHHKKSHGESAVPPKVKIASDLMAEGSTGDEKPAIVKLPAHAPKPMSAEEASLQLQIIKERFLVFLNAETNRVNVLVKRKDGNHGLVEPDF
ncbi:MAG: ribosome-associated translation inhibitor RaiA [Candidatus Omnitrophota bacterium]|nr:ribosome-associated translation inhibitor RaiA [Candidatus Omnitrophota bacterium]